MKFCISNLAWKKSEENKVLSLINKKIRFLEYAPSLIIKNPALKKDILKVKDLWKKRKISLYSMQSILYNTKNSYIFGNKKQRDNFYGEIKKKIILAKILKTKIIVFGSPKNKKTFGKKKEILDKISFEMFKRISIISEKYKIIFCIEANPKIYGTKYLTHTVDAVKLAKKINNKFFKVNLDLSTVISNKENIDYLLKNHLNYFGHAQISSPNLINLLRYKKDILIFLSKLKKYGYKKVISIETLRKKRDNLSYIKNIIKLIK
jgi:D-psicose/D-tagatose/L-ribulose 3-epimerase